MTKRTILAVVAATWLAGCGDSTPVDSLPAESAAADSGNGVPSGTYAVDPSHAYVTFYYLHQDLSFPLLRATAINGELEYDAANIENSKVQIAIRTDSIRSNVDYFDDELASRKFFNAERFPYITFESNSYEVLTGNDGLVRGEVTIRGVTQPLELGVTLNNAIIHPMRDIPVIGFSATGELNRSAFGMDRFIQNVSDTVEFRIEIEFLQGSNESSRAAVEQVSPSAAGAGS